MGNLRTLDGFEAHLTEDLKWREAELDTWFRFVRKARQHERSGLLRGGVTLLYAHWEGYIKEAARAYLEHVSRKGSKGWRALLATRCCFLTDAIGKREAEQELRRAHGDSDNSSRSAGHPSLTLI